MRDTKEGGSRFKALARLFIWWPGVYDELENLVKECDRCQLVQHNPVQAPVSTSLGATLSPWEWLHAGYTGPFLGRSCGRCLLRMVEVIPTSTATAQTTIDGLRNIIATHRLPKIIVMNNRPQITDHSAEFNSFTKNNGIKHIKYSP